MIIIIISIIISIMKLNKQKYFHYCTILTLILHLFFILLKISTNSVNAINANGSTKHGQNQQSTILKQKIPCSSTKMAVVNRKNSDNRLIMNHQKQKNDCSASIMMTLNEEQNQKEQFANIHWSSIKITLTNQSHKNSLSTLIKSISKKWKRFSNLLNKSANVLNDQYHTKPMDTLMLFFQNEYNWLSFYQKMQWPNNSIATKHFGEYLPQDKVYLFHCYLFHNHNHMN